MISLILYKCFRTNGKDIFQLTNAFGRLISVTFCIVVRVRALTSLSRILKNQPFAPTLT